MAHGNLPKRIEERDKQVFLYFLFKGRLPTFCRTLSIPSHIKTLLPIPLFWLSQKEGDKCKAWTVSCETTHQVFLLKFTILFGCFPPGHAAHQVYWDVHRHQVCHHATPTNMLPISTHLFSHWTIPFLWNFRARSQSLKANRKFKSKI